MSEVVWFGRHAIFLDQFPDNLSSIIEFIQIILKKKLTFVAQNG